MKLNYQNLNRPNRELKRFVFKDEANPDAEWPIWLRRIDPTEQEAARAHADDLKARYITGGFYDDRTGSFCKEPLPFHAIHGVVPTLSLELFKLMAEIAASQSGAPEDEVYTVEELIGNSICMPDAWEELKAVRRLLQGGADPKAVWTAFMAPPSDQESSTESAT